MSSINGRARVGERSYAPYGETYKISGTQGNSFTGDYQDVLSGLFDTPNRELNQSQGRWASPDPSHAGWNAYAYSANPLGDVDPSGLRKEYPFWMKLLCNCVGGGSTESPYQVPDWYESMVSKAAADAAAKEAAKGAQNNNEINTKPPTADPAGTRKDPKLNPPPSNSRTDVVLYGAGSGKPQNESPEFRVMHWLAGTCSGTSCSHNNNQSVTGVEIDGGGPLRDISDNPKKGEAYDHISREARTINQWWSVGGKQVQVVLGIEGARLVTTWGVQIVVHGGFDEPPSYSQAPNSPPQ